MDSVGQGTAGQHREGGVAARARGVGTCECRGTEQVSSGAEM